MRVEVPALDPDHRLQLVIIEHHRTPQDRDGELRTRVIYADSLEGAVRTQLRVGTRG